MLAPPWQRWRRPSTSRVNEVAASAGPGPTPSGPGQQRAVKHTLRCSRSRGARRAASRWSRIDRQLRSASSARSEAYTPSAARFHSFSASPSSFHSSCLQFARPSAGAAFEEPAPGEALTVSDDAVSALFETDLPVIGLSMMVERQKEWNLRNAQKQHMNPFLRVLLRDLEQ